LWTKQDILEALQDEPDIEFKTKEKPMTPDEVVKVLEEDLRRNNLAIQNWYKPEYFNKNRGQALSSAITQIQDYQKLRGKVDKERIESILIYMHDMPKEKIAQSIVTYLQQPTEH
jgi:hypothetical protein